MWKRGIGWNEEEGGGRKRREKRMKRYTRNGRNIEKQRQDGERHGREE